MKFQDYTYERPDFDLYKKDFLHLVDNLKEAESADQVKQAIDEVSELTASLDTMGTLASIRNSIDTKDDFYDQEDKYWNEYSPYYQELSTTYYKAIMASPYLDELKDTYPRTFFQNMQFELDAFDSSVIDLLQKENQLSSDYQKLIASAEIEFDGKKLTLSQFGPYLESTDRDIRKAASDAQWSFFEENESKLDDLYDELVKVRDTIAKKLGYKDFVELGYVRMKRFDYDRSMVDVYRKQVLDYVVPVTQKLSKRQAERIGIEDMKHYDASLQFLDGNPTPQGDPDYIIDNGRKMYHELSDETAEFIDFLFDKELVDLLSKEGKAGGGYCTYIPDYQSPFIFANFNGTSGDIDVLTHEAGHAFQVYQSRWIKQPEIVFPTFETCEIHSMSMEFFTYPWMELFFKEQTDKYKFNHLSGAVRFLPYGVLVDHFQHEVYENPEWSPEKRKQVWRELEKQYLPERDFSENDFLDKGTFWFRQGHIFGMPFYYIDYTLAQICALQFWKRAIVDKDENAWSDYLAICKAGGTQSFLETVETANLRSPFEEGSLEGVIQTIDQALEEVDDKAL
ncbi:M3 family oligoendopeptidase [Alkalibacterium pelagium]|uniref:Oligoendopeptidase, M3 family n=1 Tax=Alkalibacterium pelagium TaxID=426702 RepID=A0A1H7MX45_9LACT|nr:M3 family oligoendopeptidase [Alkalibacterium pelagium]GEN51243.1 M3 family oligoendopeptidase [Alkalibacterium pelagium]SEL15783.1 oligoendopeptidase, M3 family [Alkalibacterium pelagium]